MRAPPVRRRSSMRGMGLILHHASSFVRHLKAIVADKRGVALGMVRYWGEGSSLTRGGCLARSGAPDPDQCPGTATKRIRAADMTRRDPGTGQIANEACQLAGECSDARHGFWMASSNISGSGSIFTPDPAVVGTEFIREGGRGGPERSGRWCEHCVGLWKRTTRGLTFSGT